MLRPALGLLALLAACGPPPPPAPVVLYVVRHAERLDASDDPPLSAAGEARARALADSLARWGLPSQVLATRFVRAFRTAAPAAALADLTVETYGGSPDAAADARALAAQLRRARAGQRVLVVGHSNTIPALLNALDGGARPDLAHGDYDGLYLVVVRQGRATVQRVRYGADDGTPDPEH